MSRKHFLLALAPGQYFFRTGRGAILQGAVWDSSIPSYPLLLLDSGYHIGKTYKVWSPGAPADAPYGGQNHAYEKAGSAFRFQYDKHVMDMMANGSTIEAAKARVQEKGMRTYIGRAAIPWSSSGGPLSDVLIRG